MAGFPIRDFADPAPDAGSREKARALLALLGPDLGSGLGADGSPDPGAPEAPRVPDADMRAWAAELIRAIEGGEGAPGKVRTSSERSGEAETEQAAGPPDPGAGGAEPGPGDPSAKAERPAADFAPDAPASAGPFSRRDPFGTLRVPPDRAPEGPAPAPPKARAAPMPAPKGRDAIRAHVLAHVPLDALAGEHPAVVALRVADWPLLEQAGALASLPPARVRAVRRALAVLEPPRPPLVGPWSRVPDAEVDAEGTGASITGRAEEERGDAIASGAEASDAERIGPVRPEGAEPVRDTSGRDEPEGALPEPVQAERRLSASA